VGELQVRCASLEEERYEAFSKVRDSIQLAEEASLQKDQVHTVFYCYGLLPWIQSNLSLSHQVRQPHSLPLPSHSSLLCLVRDCLSFSITLVVMVVCISVWSETICHLA
jgi:hypothetical protein